MHHENMSMQCTPHYTPPLYSKTGAYRGIHYSLISAPKHRPREPVGTASLRRFQRVPTINVPSKNKKKKSKKKIKMKIVIFMGVKNHCLLHGRVLVMDDSA